jgi:citrate lyase subunit beta/citryl-CoA lyase
MIDGAIQSDADQVFVDLEDSLHPNEKIEARTTLIEAVRDNEWGEMPVSYRINSVRTRWWYEDVIEVLEEVGQTIHSIIIPKVQDPMDVRTVENLLRQVEVNAGIEAGGIDLAVQIENATGMGNVEQIAHASDRLSAVIFGAGDYSASIGSKGHVLGINSDYPGYYWQYPLSRISHAAASADLLAIDGLYTNVDDIDGFRKSCTYARMLGYDGKWVLQADQTATANEVFSPSRDDIERAKRIVEAYETSTDNTIPTVDQKVVDAETVEMAHRVLERARQAGILD